LLQFFRDQVTFDFSLHRIYATNFLRTHNPAVFKQHGVKLQPRITGNNGKTTRSSGKSNVEHRLGALISFLNFASMTFMLGRFSSFKYQASLSTGFVENLGQHRLKSNQDCLILVPKDEFKAKQLIIAKC